MSDSYDSDCSSSSINNYCKKSGERVINENKTKLMNHKKKRRIVMKIDFDNSDESSANDDNHLSDDDSMKVLRTKKPRKYFDSSSSDNNIESCGSGVGPSNSKGCKKIETSGSIGKIRSPTNNAFDSDSSSNDLLEKCPICLLTFRNQEIGSPSVCDHIFCARCIEEWSKNVHTCPFDRLTFDTIIVRDTYQNRITVREIKVDSSIIQSVNEEDEEITLCEVCSQPDREDVMLLCDSCNQGYHIDCLSPALNEIPEGSWFCDNCFDSDDDIDEDINFLYEDMREMGIPETRLTITELHQPRILRTRQNERIRATIIARTRSTRQSSNNAVSTSTSAEASNSRGSRFNQRNTKIKTPSKKTKKQRKVKRRPTRRTYVVEYDVNKFDEKFELKTKNRYVCRRRRRKSRKSKKKNLYKRVSKNCSGNSRLSVSSRLTGKFSFTPNNQSIRSILPSHNFSLFGSVNELEYFSDNEVCSDIELGGGSTAVQTSVRISNLHTSLRNRKEIQVNLNRPSTSNQADLVSSILEMQDRWQNSVQHLTSLNYGDDGSITFNRTNTEKQTSHSEVIPNNNKKDNSTKVNSTDFTQAPMYPRGNYQNYAGGARGNGNNNNRFNNQSTYRSGGGGNSYRNSFGNNRVNSETAQGSGNNPFNNSENNAYQFNNSNQTNFSNLNNRDRFNRNNRNNRNSNNSIRNQNMSRDNNLNNSNLLFENNVPTFEPVNENSHSHLNFGAISNSVYNPRNNIPPVYGPVNSDENVAIEASITNTPSSFASSHLAALPLDLPPLAPPPLAPPAINKTLFEISTGYANYDDEDDDSNCPNFSVYSVESQQAANPSVDQDDGNSQPVDCSSKEDDDEDLVQLGDEDELIEQVEMNKSELYEPENPTENVEESDPNKIENINDNSFTQIIQENNKENSLDSSSTNAEISNDSYINNKLNDGENGNKKGILELYDDSDWEELEIDKNSELNQVENSPDNNKTNDNCDADRSYTPCLDENENPNEYDDGGFTPEIGLSTIPPMLNNLNIDDLGDGRTNDPLTSNIDGIETELISEDDSDGSEKKKDDNRKIGSNQQFKKITKSQRERNYRSEKTRDSTSTHRRHSRSQTNDKENEGEKYPKRNERKRIRRQELPRYDVRNVIGQQPRVNEDRFGRNTSRPPRSRSRSRHQRNSRSRSRSFSRRRKRRSFSMSPSPNGHYSGRSPHRHFSPRRSKARYRSRSHSPHPRQFSPIRRRSRSPLRMRSRSISAGKLRQPKRLPRLTKSKTPPRRGSPRTNHSKSPDRRAKIKRKRSKDRKKRKNKRRPLSVSPAAPTQHTFYNAPPVNIKKKRHHNVKNRSTERAWSPSPSPETKKKVDANISWTPPLTYLNKPVSQTNVVVNNKHKKEKKKREKKRRKGEKRRDATSSSRKEKRRRRVSELRDSPAVAPSKEVFASGNNILVSVSFNKDSNPAPQTTVVTLPSSREQILSAIRRSRERQTRRIKYPKEKLIKKHKKTDAKPVAIIDLERSPFQVTQPNNDIIILTDSEGGNEDLINVGTSEISSVQQDHQQTENFHNSHRSNKEQSPIMDRLDTLAEEPFEIQQFGPKTPPEPPTVKFAITIKNKQIKSRNPLHNDVDDNESTILEEQQDRQEVEDSACSSGLITNVIGPNTPSDLGPCSPDAYDPFDPTKSPSMSPQSPAPKTDMPHVSTTENEGLPEIREARNSVPVNQEKVINSVDLVMALKGSKTNVVHTTTQDGSSSNEMGIQFNLQSVENEKVDETVSNGAIGGDTGGNSSTGGDNSNIQVLSNMLLSGNSIQHLPPIASPIIKSSTQSLISKLPMPKLCSNSRVNISGSGNDCGSSNVNDDILEIESPYSPSPADFEDLFEPPPDTNGANVEKQYSNFKRKKNTEMFDSLFGSSPGHSRMLPFTGSTGRKQRPSKSSKKTSVKVGKLPGDEQIRLYDDVPNSAVELQIKDKYLRKLNRQERVVEEVKLVLKPHFNRKYITKEDYKDIMRKSVPKICHSKSGEINPKKIQNLIEAYVKKYRQKNKLNLLNTQGQVSSAVKCAAYLKKL